MESKNELTGLIVQVPRSYKKKLKEISVAQDTSMTQLVLEALETTYKELKEIGHAKKQ
jgi:hypothetical protein